jgi:uncharacterized membrane protein YhhN
MMINALLRYGKTSSQSFWLVFFGATLFFISDSILAVNKFLQTIDHAGALIMFTYCAAQFLIVHGLIKHPKSEYASV